MSAPHRDFAVVFRGPAVEAEIVRTLLEQVGIPALVNEDRIAMLLPHLVDPGGDRTARVLVPAEQEERACAEIERAKRSDDE